MSSRSSTPTPPEPARGSPTDESDNSSKRLDSNGSATADARGSVTESAFTAPIATRELLRVVGNRPGPTLLILAGIHGNEPAGLGALARIEAPLRAMQADLHGTVLALAGNLGALNERVRFRGKDLNRMWTRAQVATLTEADDQGIPEREEQRALITAFENAAAEAKGPVVCVDLHTSSSDGPPFVCLGDTLDARRVGMALGVPLILGLEECIDGSVMEWFDDRGRIALAFEGGKHNDPLSVDHMESALWLAIRGAGLVHQSKVDPAPHEARLANASAGVPKVLEVFYRHALTGDEGFVMHPGMQSFEQVTAHQDLAKDNEGSVRAPQTSHLLLPLYQGKGDDGFFLAKAVNRANLWLGSILRRTGIAGLLSGGTKVDGDPYSRHVGTTKAGGFRQSMWRAAGYRRVREEAGQLRIARRWSKTDNQSVRLRN